jgi:hypothetical protein
MVVQRYIEKPMLLGGLKFDLRIYLVLTGINSGEMRGYVYEEGLVRFCTQKYEKPSSDNFKKVFMHLTNYSINKGSD